MAPKNWRYHKFLDPERILKETPNLKRLKTTLKKDPIKGNNLYFSLLLFFALFIKVYRHWGVCNETHQEG